MYAGATAAVIHKTFGANTLGTGKVTVMTSSATATPIMFAMTTNVVRIS